MRQRRSSGASYVEVLVATAILAATLIPATQALHSGIAGSEVHGTRTELHFRLRGRLAELLALPFEALDAEAVAVGNRLVPSPSYSDPPGTANRRLVFLSRYDGDDVDPTDGDPFTDTDEGLLWIRVAIEATPFSIERLVHDDD